MSDFKIDKKIPYPEIPSSYRNRYPFRSMNVGDSFALGTDELLHVRTASAWFGRRNDMKFSTRKHDGAYRCWRIK